MSSDEQNGKPVIRNYEGMKAANEGFDEFYRNHAGHRTTEEIVSERLIVTRCLECGDEYRQQYEPAVTSN